MKFLLNRHKETGLWYWKADDPDKLSDMEFISFQGVITSAVKVTGVKIVTMPPGSIVHYRQYQSVKEYSVREEISVEVASFMSPTLNKVKETTVFVLNTLNPFPITRQEMFDCAEAASQKALEYDRWLKLQQDSKPKVQRNADTQADR
jgi:hypothetical protein